MNKPYLNLLLALLCLFGFSASILAQSQKSASEASSTPISGWSAQLDSTAEELKKPDSADEILSQLRDELEAIRGEARKWIGEQTPNVERVQKELEALGLPPGEGEEPEAAGVAAQRQELKARLADLTGPIKEADLIFGRANGLISEIGEIRRKRFAEKIMTRGPSPLSPSVWRRALPEITWIAKSVSRSATSVVASPLFQEKLRESILVLFAAVIFAVILVWPVHRWLLR